MSSIWAGILNKGVKKQSRPSNVHKRGEYVATLLEFLCNMMANAVEHWHCSLWAAGPQLGHLLHPHPDGGLDDGNAQPPHLWTWWSTVVYPLQKPGQYCNIYIFMEGGQALQPSTEKGLAPQIVHIKWETDFLMKNQSFPLDSLSPLIKG